MSLFSSHQPIAFSQGEFPKIFSQGQSPSIQPIFAVIPTKRIFIGERVFPFSGLSLISNKITNIRWRKNSGIWNVVSQSTFTDILAATRFVSDLINVFGTNLFEVELTDINNVVRIFGVSVSVKITVGNRKIVKLNEIFRPFSVAQIAEDPTQIKSVEFGVDVDQLLNSLSFNNESFFLAQGRNPRSLSTSLASIPFTTIKQPIKRTQLAIGKHSGVNASSTLTSTQDFSLLNLRLNIDIVKNITDGSQGVISTINNNILTATLSGGVSNLWNTNDIYQIVDGDDLVEISKRLQSVSSKQSGLFKYNLFVTDLINNVSSDSVDVFVN